LAKGEDIRKRLLDFAAHSIRIGESLPNTFAASHIGMQLIRAASSPAVHYGEAQSAESRRDFIHKMKVCLKELRECLHSHTLILQMKWHCEERMLPIIKENNELISIFVVSINTAQNRSLRPW
jgi:four helix bundle protein